jgi:succinate dehydrogenase / fumarate reductase iron-sulfur subunit
MLTKDSKQVSRWRWPTRFPVPRNAGASPESRIEPGKTWPEPEGATRVQHLRVFRYEPESGRNPHIDTYAIDRDKCGPMLLDALIKIKNEIDPTLAFRRSCREGVCGSCSMNIDGTNWLACIRSLDEIAEPSTVYPLNNMDVIKDLVGDQTHALAQYTSIQPRRGSVCSRRRNASGWTVTTSASCVSAAPQAAPATGGMATASLARLCCCRRIVG